MARSIAKQLFLFLCVVVGLLAPHAADAHRLNVFASLAGQDVCVEAGFGKNHPAQKARVLVTDPATKKELLTGTTDTKGTFRFSWNTLPHDNGLLITVDAGEGHVNSWLLESFPSEQAKTNADTANLRTLVREEVTLALQPLVHELAQARAYTTPGLKDILGGLGWIVGITGLCYAFRKRSPHA